VRGIQGELRLLRNGECRRIEGFQNYMPDCTRRGFAGTILKSLTLYSFVGGAISSQA
jgi:hypothetical protein